MNSHTPKCWNCGCLGHMQHNCRKRASQSGKGADARWSSNPRARALTAFRKVAAIPPSTLSWVMLDPKVGNVPAIVDTGAQFLCVRSDVAEYLYLNGEHCSFMPCSVTCLLTEGKMGEVSNAAKLHISLLSFSWDHEFKVLNDGPFPAILGLDFLQRAQMRVDLPTRNFSFTFAPDRVGSFLPLFVVKGMSCSYNSCA